MNRLLNFNNSMTVNTKSELRNAIRHGYGIINAYGTAMLYLKKRANSLQQTMIIFIWCLLCFILYCVGTVAIIFVLAYLVYCKFVIIDSSKYNIEIKSDACILKLKNKNGKNLLEQIEADK